MHLLNRLLVRSGCFCAVILTATVSGHSQSAESKQVEILPRPVSVTGSASAGAPTIPASAPKAAQSSTRPSLGLSFDDVRAGNGRTPPDPMIAAGLDRILVVTNDDATLFQKNGGEIGRAELRSFLNVLTVGTARPFDPRCYFDAKERRFIVVATIVQVPCANNYVYTPMSYLCLAVSKTASPAAFDGNHWNRYTFNSLKSLGAGLVGYFGSDYPDVAFDDEAIYITALYAPLVSQADVDSSPALCGSRWSPYGGYYGSRLLIVNKAAVLQGLSSAGAVRSSQNPDGFFAMDGAPLDPAVDPFAWSLRAVYATDTVGQPAGNALFIGLDQRVRMMANGLRLVAIANPLSLSPTLLTGTVGIPNAFEPMVFVRQPGTALVLDNGDHRILNAYRVGDSIFLAHTIQGSPQRTWARFYELRKNGWPNGGNPALIQTGDVPLKDEANPAHTFFPAIGANSFGDVALVMATGSADWNASVAVCGRKGADLPGSLGPLVTTQEGPSNYVFGPGASGECRWGDYFGIAVDPVDLRTFWSVGQFAKQPLVWSTHVQSFTIGESLSSYGTGFAGSLGVPSLIGTSEPRLCANLSLQVESVGIGNSAGVLAIGTASANLPTAFGGNLLVMPRIISPIGLANDRASIDLGRLPCDPSLLGARIFFQALILDSTSPSGVAFSRGLRATIGP